ncbi:Caspase-1 [Armadillidium vulgare]|nr:Caspase-1 [Armadillidium vulgare]
MATVNSHETIENKLSNLKIDVSNDEVSQNNSTENQIDGKVKGNGVQVELPPGYAFTQSLADDEVYNMNYKKRGYCVIFNHKNFDYHLSLDAYQVDHSECDCFVMIFMSHGEQQILWAKDDNFKPDILFNEFTADNCPSLSGKPKLFFVQACRGDSLDKGYKMVSKVALDQTDSGASIYTIPNHADFLVCWSTVPGHYSWRNTTNGSWFIQSLVLVFRKYANSRDVLTMMTMVNRHMILNFESNCPNLL